MKTFSKSRDGVIKRATFRNDLCDRKSREKIADIDAACRVWLLKRCPGYREELASKLRGVTFGKMANRKPKPPE